MQKTMRSWRPAVATAVLASTAQAEDKKWTKVTIATEGAFKPYNFTKPDGTLDGYEIELDQISLRPHEGRMQDRRPELRRHDPGAQCRQVRRHHLRHVGDGKARGSHRLQHLLRFTGQAFATLEVQRARKPADARAKSSHSRPTRPAPARRRRRSSRSLQGKTIGVQTASTAARLRRQVPEGYVEVREYKTTEEHDLDLAAGRVDLVMASMGLSDHGVREARATAT